MAGKNFVIYKTSEYDFTNDSEIDKSKGVTGYTVDGYTGSPFGSTDGDGAASLIYIDMANPVDNIDGDPAWTLYVGAEKTQNHDVNVFLDEGDIMVIDGISDTLLNDAQDNHVLSYVDIQDDYIALAINSNLYNDDGSSKYQVFQIKGSAVDDIKEKMSVILEESGKELKNETEASWDADGDSYMREAFLEVFMGDYVVEPGAFNQQAQTNLESFVESDNDMQTSFEVTSYTTIGGKKFEYNETSEEFEYTDTVVDSQPSVDPAPEPEPTTEEPEETPAQTDSPVSSNNSSGKDFIIYKTSEYDYSKTDGEYNNPDSVERSKAVDGRRTDGYTGTHQGLTDTDGKASLIYIDLENPVANLNNNIATVQLYDDKEGTISHHEVNVFLDVGDVMIVDGISDTLLNNGLGGFALAHLAIESDSLSVGINSTFDDGSSKYQDFRIKGSAVDDIKQKMSVILEERGEKLENTFEASWHEDGDSYMREAFLEVFFGDYVVEPDALDAGAKAALDTFNSQNLVMEGNVSLESYTTVGGKKFEYNETSGEFQHTGTVVDSTPDEQADPAPESWTAEELYETVKVYVDASPTLAEIYMDDNGVLDVSGLVGHYITYGHDEDARMDRYEAELAKPENASVRNPSEGGFTDIDALIEAAQKIADASPYAEPAVQEPEPVVDTQDISFNEAVQSFKEALNTYAERNGQPHQLQIDIEEAGGDYSFATTVMIDAFNYESYSTVTTYFDGLKGFGVSGMELGFNDIYEVVSPEISGTSSGVEPVQETQEDVTFEEAVASFKEALDTYAERNGQPHQLQIDIEAGGGDYSFATMVMIDAFNYESYSTVTTYFDGLKGFGVSGMELGFNDVYEGIVQVYNVAQYHFTDAQNRLVGELEQYKIANDGIDHSLKAIIDEYGADRVVYELIQHYPGYSTPKDLVEYFDTIDDAGFGLSGYEGLFDDMETALTTYRGLEPTTTSDASTPVPTTPDPTSDVDPASQDQTVHQVFIDDARYENNYKIPNGGDHWTEYYTIDDSGKQVFTAEGAAKIGDEIISAYPKEIKAGLESDFDADFYTTIDGQKYYVIFGEDGNAYAFKGYLQDNLKDALGNYENEYTHLKSYYTIKNDNPAEGAADTLEFTAKGAALIQEQNNNDPGLSWVVEGAQADHVADFVKLDGITEITSVSSGKTVDISSKMSALDQDVDFAKDGVVPDQDIAPTTPVDTVDADGYSLSDNTKWEAYKNSSSWKDWDVDGKFIGDDDTDYSDIGTFDEAQLKRYFIDNYDDIMDWMDDANETATMQSISDAGLAPSGGDVSIAIAASTHFLANLVNDIKDVNPAELNSRINNNDYFDLDSGKLKGFIVSLNDNDPAPVVQDDASTDQPISHTLLNIDGDDSIGVIGHVDIVNGDVI